MWQSQGRARGRAARIVGPVVPGPVTCIGIALAAAVLLLAACGSQEDETMEGSSKETGLAGHALKESDVATIPGGDWEGGVVLAVPVEHAELLWRDPATGEVEEPLELAHAQRAVPLGPVEAHGAATQVGRGGVFSLDVPDGDYLMCVGDSPQDGLVRVFGCGEISAPALALELRTGEGGFRIHTESA